MQTIRRFFRKARDYQNAYHEGLIGPDVAVQLKIYKSHHMSPPFECNPNFKKYKPYGLKKQIQNKQKLDEMVHLLNEMLISDTSCTSENVVLDAVESNIYRGTEFSELLAQLEIIADDDMFD